MSQVGRARMFGDTMRAVVNCTSDLVVRAIFETDEACAAAFASLPRLPTPTPSAEEALPHPPAAEEAPLAPPPAAASAYDDLPPDALALVAELRSRGFAAPLRRHVAVRTMAELREVVSGYDGVVAKNIVVKGHAPHPSTPLTREDKKDTLYLVCARDDAQIDLKTLSKFIASQFGLSSSNAALRFASEEALAAAMGVAPGAVSPFSAVGARSRVVVILDGAFSSARSILLHPLVNTASVALGPSELKDFLTSHHVHFLFVDF
jgi:hypothetical protein